MRSAVVRLGVDPGRADDLLTEAGIDPRARAEQLSLAGVRADRRGAAVTGRATIRLPVRPGEAERLPPGPGCARGRVPRPGEPGAPAVARRRVTVTEAQKLDVVVDAQVELSEGLDAGGMNLTLVAALAMAEVCGGLIRGAEIRIAKRIPVAAGLGGGSADAAATLARAERAVGRAAWIATRSCRSASRSAPTCRRCSRAAR